jgi:hypothetical protein
MKFSTRAVSSLVILRLFRLEIAEEAVSSSHRQRACGFERGEDAFYTRLTATTVNETSFLSNMHFLVSFATF